MTAYQIARRATKYGVPFRTALKIARAAKAEDTHYPLAFALVEQESGFRHIFGHDTTFLAGLPVTRDRYRALVSHVRDGGTSNGVGFTQITYPSYLIENPGLWRKGKNLRFGFGLVRDEINAEGLRRGLATYNGGPANPRFSYADSVLGKKRKWANRFK